ncbi:hypothetical protein [Stenotrophomonas sp. PS02299]|uniref:hypothetical protein n=1 Tax=Stenotrophomonas TaxID=40323 RepID=UPI00249AA6C1|nr:hypothetical protein [Stenotrophomonas sp. PS02299]
MKIIVGTFTAAVVAPATADALRDAERVILGVPQSVLLVAMAGLDVRLPKEVVYLDGI